MSAPSLEFQGCATPSIGVEIELQLLDAQTLDLVDGILPLLQFYPGSAYVKPEYIQDTVEINSKICHRLDELEAHLLALTADVSARCAQLGYALCGAGTHPFCQRLAHITPLPRYRAIEKDTGYLGHSQITFAIHVHIGMSDGEQAVRVMHQLRRNLPVLLALAANSPFWWGYDTAYASYRHRILAATRSYGLPPDFYSWDEFCELFQKAQRADLFQSFRDIHWDMRPRPDLGTVEVRIMDAQPTIKDTLTLAALTSFLAEYFKEPRETADWPLQPLPYWFEKENKYRTSHQGLEAEMITDGAGRTRPMRRVIEDMIDALGGFVAARGEMHYLDRLRALLAEGPSYQRQRAVFQQTGSLRAVVAALSEALQSELRALTSKPQNAKTQKRQVEMQQQQQ